MITDIPIHVFMSHIAPYLNCADLVSLSQVNQAHFELYALPGLLTTRYSSDDCSLEWSVTGMESQKDSSNVKLIFCMSSNCLGVFIEHLNVVILFAALNRMSHMNDGTVVIFSNSADFELCTKLGIFVVYVDVDAELSEHIQEFAQACLSRCSIGYNVICAADMSIPVFQGICSSALKILVPKVTPPVTQ
jgi:hypothetical protein